MSEATTFPRRGQIWEATHIAEAHIQYLFSAPITFSGDGSLAAGERVRIINEDSETLAVAVRFVPLRYDDLHESFVPRDVRDTPRYKAYMLSVNAEYFHGHFKLVEDPAS